MNLDSLVRELVREVIREEIQPLREELRALAEGIRDGREIDGARGGEFFTVEEIAAELKISRGTVRTWIAAGALRASRPGVAGRDGRVYRIARSDLDSFLATKQSVPRDDVDIQAEAARIVANVARKRLRRSRMNP
jgi:excisionase family DNA binding protein